MIVDDEPLRRKLICIYCGARTLDFYMCEDCQNAYKNMADKNQKAPIRPSQIANPDPNPDSVDRINNPANPTTSIFTKPSNPVEGKDPSVKQALELEQQAYIDNKKFAEEHPEIINKDEIEGTKSGEQVLREAEAEIKENE